MALKRSKRYRGEGGRENRNSIPFGTPAKDFLERNGSTSVAHGKVHMRFSGVNYHHSIMVHNSQKIVFLGCIHRIRISISKILKLEIPRR